MYPQFMFLAKVSDGYLKIPTFHYSFAFSYIVPTLRAENLMTPTNVHLMRGFIQLGRLLKTNTDVKDVMSPQDVFHK